MSHGWCNKHLSSTHTFANRLDMFGMIFTSFCAHGWDIRIDEDLRKGSVMSDVIELLLHNNHIIPKSLMEDDTKGGRDILDALGASHVSLQWLIKQLEVSPPFTYGVQA